MKPYASIVIIETTQNKILLLKRSETAPEYPGLWNLPGGHIEGDETPLEAAFREVQEETDLWLGSTENTDCLVTIRGVVVFHVPIYIAPSVLEDAEATPVTLNEESSEYRWLAPKNALDYLLVPASDDALRYWRVPEPEHLR